MFQTIIKLYNSQVNKIYFGGSIIVCDEKNICSVYYDTIDNKVLPSSNIATLVTSN